MMEVERGKRWVNGLGFLKEYVMVVVMGMPLV
jgi:hypothetical protein